MGEGQVGRQCDEAAIDGERARIWDARTGAKLAVLSGHGDNVLSAAVVYLSK
jgi:hypothetical protein